MLVSPVQGAVLTDSKTKIWKIFSRTHLSVTVYLLVGVLHIFVSNSENEDKENTLILF